MFTLVVVSILLSIIRVSGQACNATTLCPASAPCCSEYGFCGSGSQFCLGGCNPLFSNTLNSCQPSPICQSQQYTFTDSSRILSDPSQYDGDADKYDWTLDGGNFTVNDDNLVMILTKTNSGTRLSSTRFIHYGKITATMKTGRWGGVVTGFITMSNIRDEIDWEWPGSQVTEAQTNFFWQGQNSQGSTTDGLTDTSENYHDYTIDWSPDALVFQIDGKTVRTIQASDYNKNGVSQFPSTPSRIQLSVWPGGDDSQYPGTVSWAGGPINWNDPDYVAAGNQFQVPVKSISVTCNDPQAPTTGQVSYVYAQGSTASKQTINLSTENPIIDGASTGNSTVGTVPASSASTSTTGSTTSTSSTQATGTTTASPTGSSGSSRTNGQDQGEGEHRKGGVFEVVQADAPSPSSTPAGGHNSTGDGFFGALGGNDASSDGSSSSSSQTVIATTSSTQPTSTNKSGAHTLDAGMLPAISTALLMALALIF